MIRKRTGAFLPLFLAVALGAGLVSREKIGFAQDWVIRISAVCPKPVSTLTTTSSSSQLNIAFADSQQLTESYRIAGVYGWSWTPDNSYYGRVMAGTIDKGAWQTEGTVQAIPLDTPDDPSPKPDPDPEPDPGASDPTFPPVTPKPTDDTPNPRPLEPTKVDRDTSAGLVHAWVEDVLELPCSSQAITPEMMAELIAERYLVGTGLEGAAISSSEVKLLDAQGAAVQAIDRVRPTVRWLLGLSRLLPFLLSRSGSGDLRARPKKGHSLRSFCREAARLRARACVSGVFSGRPRLAACRRGCS